MLYALLVYNTDESGYDRLSAEEDAEMAQRHAAYSAMLHDRNAFDTTLELAGADAATSVRHAPTGKVVTDGPYAESKEILGGLYIVEADSLDAATDYARSLPTRPGDTVEVRCQAVSGDTRRA